MAEWLDPDFDSGPVGAWADAVNLGGELDNAEGDDEEWHSVVGDEEYIEAGDADGVPDTSDKYWADPAEATQEALDVLLDKWTTGERIYARVCYMLVVEVGRSRWMRSGSIETPRGSTRQVQGSLKTKTWHR